MNFCPLVAPIMILVACFSPVILLADRPQGDGKQKRELLTEKQEILRRAPVNAGNLLTKPAPRRDREFLDEILLGKHTATVELARKIAFKSFMRKPFVRANQSVVVDELFQLDVPMEGFSDPGDLIWRARLLSLNGGRKSVAGELWINSENGRVVDRLAGTIVGANSE